MSDVIETIMDFLAALLFNKGGKAASIFIVVLIVLLFCIGLYLF